MSQLIVTTGTRFTDIDALACVMAYKEIPVQPPLAVIPGELNLSVTIKIRSWPLDYLTTFENSQNCNFVVVDVSEISQLGNFVDKDRIIEIYDHHFGFEKYWREKLGDKAKIEEVGACATLIWEEFKRRKWRLDMRNVSRNEDEKCGKKNFYPPSLPKPDIPPTSHPSISPLAANLLYTAIVSNTLNFHASVTTQRDRQAFEELKTFIDLPANWIPQYYQDQEVEIYTNPRRAIEKDTKIQTIKGMRCAVGQLELWNSQAFIKEYQREIEMVLKEFNTEIWFFTSPSISEGRNYIFTKSEIVKNLLRQVMAIDFFGTDIGVTKKLWLRKEILKLIQ